MAVGSPFARPSCPTLPPCLPPPCGAWPYSLQVLYPTFHRSRIASENLNRL
jgi:hypothetical protein